MVQCPRLPTITAATPHLVHLAILRSEALGDPTAGHLATEHLQSLLQDPQQPQSLQLQLATAGTHGVPKDETGSHGKLWESYDPPPPPLFFFCYFFFISPGFPSQPISTFRVTNEIWDYLHHFFLQAKSRICCSSCVKCDCDQPLDSLRRQLTVRG